MESYKLGPNTPIQMPSGWHEISYNKAVKILDGKLNEIETLALLTGRTEKEIRTATDVNTIFHFMNAFQFLKDLPQKLDEFPRSVKLGEDRLIFPYISYADKFDLGKAEVQQVEDMLFMITKMSKEFEEDKGHEPTNEEFHNELLPKISPFLVAIYLQKIIETRYNGEHAMELVERVKKELSFKEVVSIGYFFLIRLMNFRSGSVKSLKIYHSIPRRLRRAFLDLIQRLVS